jgi:hypothetical protein
MSWTLLVFVLVVVAQCRLELPCMCMCNIYTPAHAAGELFIFTVQPDRIRIFSFYQ